MGQWFLNFSRLIFDPAFLYLQVMRTSIKAWISSEFGSVQNLSRTLELLGPEKNTTLYVRIQLPTHTVPVGALCVPCLSIQLRQVAVR